MNGYQWKQSYLELVIGALGTGFIASILFMVVAGEYFGSFACIGGALLWGIITTATFHAFGSFNRTAVHKFFLVDDVVARTVVANVLSSKAWPFTQTDKGFALDTVEIRINSGAIARGSLKGVYIALGPYRGNNQLLIDSLKEKIDEAFMPRGLG